MENQIDIVKDIAESMIGIGGIPNNQEFYVEFNSRLTAKLGIKDDWDCLEKSLEDYKKKIEIAEKALNDILKWQEDTSENWEYPETIAEKALEKLAKIDGF